MMFMFMVMGCFFHELAIPGGSILGPWFSWDDFTVSHTVDKWFSHFYFGARNFRFDQKKKKKKVKQQNNFKNSTSREC